MGRALFIALLILASGGIVWAGIFLPLETMVVPYNGEAEIVIPVPDWLENPEFVLIRSPAHGSLSGELPEVVYKPTEGFYGEDTFEVAIYNASTGELVDTVLVGILVLPPQVLKSPPVFGWDASITSSGPSFAVEGFSSGASLRLRYTSFDVELRARWEDDAFEFFHARGTYHLEIPLPTETLKLPLSLNVDFDPTTPGLKYWSLDASLNLSPWSLSYKFYFSGTDPQTDSYTEFRWRGKIGDISFNGSARFQGLTLDFSRLALNAQGKLSDLGCNGCDIKWNGSLSFTKEEGLESFCFTVEDIPVPCPSCGPIRTLANFKATFTPTEKTLEPALRLIAGWAGCVKPKIALISPESGFGISGIELYGMEIKCEFSGDITGRFLTSFDPEKDVSVTGDSHFFEVWRLDGPIPGCCGGMGRWQLGIFFSRESGYLHGLRKGEMTVHFPLFRNFTVTFGLGVGLVDPTDPTKTWEAVFGWKGIF